MTPNGWFQIFFFLLVIFAITKPLGVFMTRVFQRDKTFLDFALSVPWRCLPLGTASPTPS